MIDPSNKPRVMWLMNHERLRKFEVPLLVSMGYELFLPKSFPYDEDNLNASIDYKFDSTLSIPAETLETLNQQDFYDRLTPETARIVNECFDFAVIGFSPAQLDGLVRDFNGTIIMRTFGLANGLTYTEAIAQSLGPAFFSRLEKIQERFWIGQAYPNLAEIEKSILVQRAVHLPLGLANADRPAWKGTLPKILFTCPRIKTTNYFGNIYREFKRNFGDLPHVISGAQPVPVDDAAVLGFLPAAKYDELFRDARVMFYQGRERSHLPYHPIEAVQAGMPLVFMADGMLDDVGGRNLPGRAKTIKEAREKLQRVLRGDTRFTDAIRASQTILLNDFSWKTCRDAWEKNFASIDASIRASAPERIEVRTKPKIAMLLTHAYLGGTLEVVKLATKMLKRGSALAGEPCDVTFYHPPSELYTKQDFSDLDKERIPVREFSWKTLDRTAALNALSFAGWHGPMPGGDRFTVPEDGVDNLSSFDHWVFLTDRLPEQVLPLRPYSVYVHDFLQRYIPRMLAPHYERRIIDNLRSAEQVLCATDQSCMDAIQYAGIAARKVRLVPLVTELLTDSEIPLPEKTRTSAEYFLWMTNLESHKNHLKAIEALGQYYERGGEFRCIIAGVNTEWFDPNRAEPKTESAYVHKVRAAFEKSNLVGDRIELRGYVRQWQYYDLLRNAEFIFHPTLIDNGTLTTVEAASAAVPVLSHDYPPMRFYERRFGIPIKFMNARSAKNIATSLIEMEDEAAALREKLPSQEELDQFHWRKQSPFFWEAVRYGIV